MIGGSSIQNNLIVIDYASDRIGIDSRVQCKHFHDGFNGVIFFATILLIQSKFITILNSLH